MKIFKIKADLSPDLYSSYGAGNYDIYLVAKEELQKMDKQNLSEWEIHQRLIELIKNKFKGIPLRHDVVTNAIFRAVKEKQEA